MLKEKKTDRKGNQEIKPPKGINKRGFVGGQRYYRLQLGRTLDRWTQILGNKNGQFDVSRVACRVCGVGDVVPCMEKQMITHAGFQVPLSLKMERKLELPCHCSVKLCLLFFLMCVSKNWVRVGVAEWVSM